MLGWLKVKERQIELFDVTVQIGGGLLQPQDLRRVVCIKLYISHGGVSPHTQYCAPSTGGSALLRNFFLLLPLH